MFRFVWIALLFAYSTILFGNEFRDLSYLAKTRSTYFDTVTRRNVQQEGKGFIVKVRKKLVVVTASHLTEGKDQRGNSTTSIQWYSRRAGDFVNLRIVKRTACNRKDVAVFEVESRDRRDILEPLATYYSESPKGIRRYFPHGYFLVTHPLYQRRNGERGVEFQNRDGQFLPFRSPRYIIHRRAATRGERPGIDSRFYPLGLFAHLPGHPGAQSEISRLGYDNVAESLNLDDVFLASRLLFGILHGEEHKYSYEDILPGMSGSPLMVFMPEISGYAIHGMAISRSTPFGQSYFQHYHPLLWYADHVEKTAANDLEPEMCACQWNLSNGVLYRSGRNAANIRFTELLNHRDPSGNGIRSDGRDAGPRMNFFPPNSKTARQFVALKFTQNRKTLLTYADINAVHFLNRINVALENPRNRQRREKQRVSVLPIPAGSHVLYYVMENLRNHGMSLTQANAFVARQQKPLRAALRAKPGVASVQFTLHARRRRGESERVTTRIRVNGESLTFTLDQQGNLVSRMGRAEKQVARNIGLPRKVQLAGRNGTYVVDISRLFFQDLATYSVLNQSRNQQGDVEPGISYRDDSNLWPQLTVRKGTEQFILWRSRPARKEKPRNG